MPILYVTCGISGSGKSYWANRMARQNDCLIVSTDAIREELFNDESDQTHNNLVFMTAYDRIGKYLSQRRNVIFDATSLKLADRKKIFDAFKDIKNITFIAVDFGNDVEKALNNQKKRYRKVPVDVVQRQSQKYIAPSFDEGWDWIYDHSHEYVTITSKERAF